MLCDDVRALLRQEENADGLTVPQICARLGATRDKVWRALEGRHMPDAYIDRWVGESAVWICVPVPENCPKPDRKERRYERNQKGNLGRPAGSAAD